MKHYKKTLIVVILFLWHSFASAQIITGIVYDKNTRLPVSNVSVFLDGTSINTMTDNSGKFSLQTKSKINTKLVLRHLSYETAFFDSPFESIPDTLYIEERDNTLDEITISADRYTREQKMKAFREQFLGITRAGRSCTIMNEDDIQLFYNMQTRRLIASSDKTIEVINNYLGYTISFVLMDFWIQFSPTYTGRALNSDGVQASFFAVVSSFTDMAPENSRIKQRRDDIYKLSSNYFFKHFANNTLTSNEFVLYKNGLAIDHMQYFAIKDTLSLKKISLIPDTDINQGLGVYLDLGQGLSGTISVLDSKKLQSTTIYFMTNSFLIDYYGNIDQIDKISFNGQMGKNRAGDMLPIDFEP